MRLPTRLLLTWLVLASAPIDAAATDLGDFPYPVTARPLVLGQEILEAEGAFAVRYFTVKDPHHDDGAYSPGAHLGTVASTLRLAAGLTDWLQLAGTATLWWVRPEVDLVKPTLEIAGLPVRWVAPRVRLTLPDARSSEAFGYAFGATGRYAFLEDTLDVLLDLDLDRYDPASGSDTRRPETTLSATLATRWSFVPRFYVAARAGLSKTWVQASPPVVLRYALEAGFTSAKHVDVVLSWGVPSDWTLPTDVHPAFRIHVVTFTVRVRR
jgi:hypothetical protein